MNALKSVARTQRVNVDFTYATIAHYQINIGLESYLSLIDISMTNSEKINEHRTCCVLQYQLIISTDLEGFMKLSLQR